jgi:predicted metal-dependent hydrolase
MITGEVHYVWGSPFRLLVIERPGRASVGVDGDRLVFGVPHDASRETMERYLDEWYRSQLRVAIPEAITRWEPVVGAKASKWGIRRMRTRWGSCNTATRQIWINLEMAKRHPESLDYLIVHELTHLLERSHGPRFKARLDRAMPDWRARQDRLNGSLLNHDIWC